MKNISGCRYGVALALCAAAVAGLTAGGARGQETNAPPASTNKVAPQKLKTGIVFDKILPFAGADQVRIEVTSHAVDPKLSTRLGITALIADPLTREVVWEGPIDVVTLEKGLPAVAARTVSNLKPRLWTPESPYFYTVTVIGNWEDVEQVRRTVRFGFRSLEVREGRLFFNGKPFFLRGTALNPPLKEMAPTVANDADFARAYIRDLKARHVNCIRTRGRTWLTACDEEGMLAMTGCFGPPPGSVVAGEKITAPTNIAEAVTRYKQDYFEADALHPSVVIHVLSEEMPAKGEEAVPFHNVLAASYEALRSWDPSRLIIGNSGVGDSRLSDIIDWHVFPGWYTDTFLEYYRARSRGMKAMPVVFTECVGARVGPAGRFRTDGLELAPALQWGGHAADLVAPSEAYQSFLMREACETPRWLRRENALLGGVMPATELYRNWTGVSRFEDMVPNAAAAQMARSFSPVLLSLESWAPHVYAGSILDVIVHEVNDAAGGVAYGTNRLSCAVTDAGGAIFARSDVPAEDLEPFAIQSRVVHLELPPLMPAGDYFIRGRLTSGSNVLDETVSSVFVASRQWSLPLGPPRRGVCLYDPPGRTAAALAALGVPAKRITALEQADPSLALVIGECAWDAGLASNRTALAERVRAGGRVLLLRQDVPQYQLDWLPVSLGLTAAGRDRWSPGMWINPERPEHPVFDRIPRNRLQLWTDPTGWNATKDGYPHVFPVWVGFRLTNSADLAQTAILADYGRGLENVALCEVFDGKGSVLVSGFDCVGRSKLDPVADRLLLNMAVYMSGAEGHAARLRVDRPIMWGDYGSERGLVCSLRQGLVENVVAEPVAKAGAAAGFASAQTVPRGRHPFGPYTFDDKCRVRDFAPESPTGSGVFWATIPASRTAVITTVQNPGAAEASLAVEVNGQAAEPAAVPAGKTVEVTAPVPRGGGNVAVRYTGPKSLVLLKTVFR